MARGLHKYYMINNSTASKLFFNQLEQAFSKERMGSYLWHSACDGNAAHALTIYTWNIELSNALYPALQIFEITLRNALNRTLIEKHQTDNWYDLENLLFHTEKRVIIAVKEKLQKENKEISPSKIISTLTFGFWTSLFDVRYEHNQILWPKLLKPVFPFYS